MHNGSCDCCAHSFSAVSILIDVVVVTLKLPNRSAYSAMEFANARLPLQTIAAARRRCVDTIDEQTEGQRIFQFDLKDLEETSRNGRRSRTSRDIGQKKARSDMVVMDLPTSTRRMTNEHEVDSSMRQTSTGRSSSATADMDGSIHFLHSSSNSILSACRTGDVCVTYIPLF